MPSVTWLIRHVLNPSISGEGLPLTCRHLPQRITMHVDRGYMEMASRRIDHARQDGRLR